MQERPMNAKLKEVTESEAKLSVVNHMQSLERWTATLAGEGAGAPLTPASRTPAA